MPCHLTDTASFMVGSKNDDIIAYTPIAKNAWHMECNLWAKASKDMKNMYDYTRFGVANFMKIRVICGRYRWMAWRSPKGLMAKQTILKIHEKKKKDRASLEHDLALLFDSI